MDWTDEQSEQVADAIEVIVDSLSDRFPDVDVSGTRQVLTVTLWGWGEEEPK